MKNTFRNLIAENVVTDCRPEVCRSYPHLHKDNINHRLLNFINNTFVCPIVYNIMEDLKEFLWTEENDPVI